MTTAERLAQLKQDFDDLYEAGKDKGADEFWEAFQKKGTRNVYQYAFHHWDCEYIRPKYKVAPTDGYMTQMFNNNPSLKKLEAAYFDFSNVPKATTQQYGNYYLFQNCSSLEELEDIGLRGDYYSCSFINCRKLRTIAVFRSNKNTVHSANTFNACNSLENITIEGVIATQNFNVQWCPLNHDSLVSIINALADKSGDSGTTWTITLGADNIAKLTADELLIIENKNWNYG